MAETAGKFIAQRQWAVTLADPNITSKFMSKTGGNTTVDSTKVYAGGGKVPTILTGVPDVENITISKAYEQGTDNKTIAALRDQVGSYTTDVIVQETTSDYEPVGNPVTYSNCTLVSVTEPEYENSSADASTWELEFAVTSISQDMSGA